MRASGEMGSGAALAARSGQRIAGLGGS